LFQNAVHLDAPHIRRLARVWASQKKYNYRDLYSTQPSAGSCHIFVQSHAALWSSEFRIAYKKYLQMKETPQLHYP